MLTSCLPRSIKALRWFEKNMETFSEIKPDTAQFSKDDRVAFGVIILISLLASMLVVAVIGGLITDENLQERIVKSRIFIVFGLQILPVLLSLIARKIDSLREFSAIIYGLTILFELIAAIIIVLFILTN